MKALLSVPSFFTSHPALVTQIVAAACLWTIGLSCNTTEPPPPPHQSTIALSVEDASCTEAWLKVSLTDASQPRTIAIQRDGQQVLSAQMTTMDSLFVVEGLLPNHTYSFVAQRLSGTTVIDVSTVVQTTTMDTTSHEFTWQIDTLGVTASTLYDVAIINDTLAYAVGEITVRDSLGNLINPPYNVAKWNGQHWELERLLYDCRLYYPNCGPEYYLYAPGRSIFAFGPNDIWVAAGTAQHWDGVRWTEYAGIEGVGTANKIWGSSSNDLYFVGYGGFIVHKSGSTWQRLESGTTLPMRDIWGGNSQTGIHEILALASTYTPELQGSLVLTITGNSATAISTVGMSPDMSSIWFVSGRRYYAVGAGIHQKRMLSDSAWNVYPPGVVTRYFSGGVRGQNVNDVLVVGSFGEVVHFNGCSWKRYTSEVLLPSGYYGKVEARGNLVMAVGQIDGSKATVLVGTR